MRTNQPYHVIHRENLRFPTMRTDTTSPYTAMIPAITTGTSDCIIRDEVKAISQRTPLAFMISSGLNVPRPAMPIPAFAVPNAAPTAVLE